MFAPRRKLQEILKKFGLLLDDVDFLSDDAKYSLVLSRLIVDFICVWPTNFSGFKRIFFFAIITLEVVHQVTMFAYFFIFVRDVEALTVVLPSLSVGMQVIGKTAILYCKTKKLEELIKTVWNDFWPSNLMGEKIENQLAQDTKRLLTPIFVEITIGLTYSAYCIIVSLNNREPVYPAWYSFDLSKSPAYVTVAILQIFLTMYVDTCLICGYDFLYNAFCINCAAQFRLLCHTTEYIGSEEEYRIIERIQNYANVESARTLNSVGDQEGVLLRICAEHHQKLIRFCNELNQIFGHGHFLQLASNLMGICTSCYRISLESNYNNILISVTHYITYLCQLFCYCCASDHLSNWVMRFSFSLYTFLKTLSSN